jgi:hypothetical protein
MNLTPRMCMAQLKVYGNTNSILLCFDPLVPFGLYHMKIFKHSSLFLSKGDHNGHGRS